MESLSHGQVMRVLYGLMAGMFLAAVESTVVATAAPTIAEDLGGINLISWIFTAYMLTTTVSSALWGKLSDLVGRRPTYLASITIFILGSLLCGLSQNMVQLIVFRGVQGIGGGGLTALSFTIMADVLAPRQRGRYVGYFSATFAAGSVVGPLVGGLLVDAFDWRAVFLVNLPLGLAAGLVAANALRGVGGRREAKLDIAGALTLSGSIICLLLAAVWGGDEYAWGSSTIIGLLRRFGRARRRLRPRRTSGGRTRHRHAATQQSHVGDVDGDCRVDLGAVPGVDRLPAVVHAGRR